MEEVQAHGKEASLAIRHIQSDGNSKSKERERRETTAEAVSTTMGQLHVGAGRPRATGHKRRRGEIDSGRKGARMEGVAPPVLDTGCSMAYDTHVNDADTSSQHLRSIHHRAPFTQSRAPQSLPRSARLCMNGMLGFEPRKNGPRLDAPEINYLDIFHPSQHPNELLRVLDPRVENRELPQACEALQWSGILQVIVIQVEYADIGNHPCKVGRECDQPACGDFEVDEVVAGFG